MKVIGIDPGSRHLGYGVLSKVGNKLCLHDFGTLHFNSSLDSNLRLVEIFEGVKKIIEQNQPSHAAIEKVFFAKNAVSSLKLGQARGVAILALTQGGLSVTEYSPNEVKKAVSGIGHADKSQIARMVSLLLGISLSEISSADTSDALAIAICHLNSYRYKERVLGL